jgi:hypothetical protein
MRFASGLSALVFALALAGCGDDESETVTVRETVTETASETGTSSVPTEAPAVLTLFFLRDGKVEPVSRVVVAGPAVARAALTELVKGPQAVEEEPGLAPTTAIPDGTELGGVSIENGVAVVELSRAIPRAAQAQVVYTLTQFPTVKLVQFLVDGPQGPPRGRAAFEPQTPAILVLSPLPGEEVESGFEVTGTANTFEATFQYELLDAAGKVLKKDFVTATSGSGMRGTFSFAVPYEVPKTQTGKLVVFEISAEDGSRTNERSISLALR